MGGDRTVMWCGLEGRPEQELYLLEWMQRIAACQTKRRNPGTSIWCASITVGGWRICAHLLSVVDIWKDG
eukprot:638402-Amphidinium_carterae.2